MDGVPQDGIGVSAKPDRLIRMARRAELFGFSG